MHACLQVLDACIWCVGEWGTKLIPFVLSLLVWAPAGPNLGIGIYAWNESVWILNCSMFPGFLELSMGRGWGTKLIPFVLSLLVWTPAGPNLGVGIYAWNDYF